MVCLVAVGGGSGGKEREKGDGKDKGEGVVCWSHFGFGWDGERGTRVQASCVAARNLRETQTATSQNM